MTPTPPYVELHCHSAYSFLDGVSLPEELAQRARELGHRALALTDHNSVSGSMELAQASADHGVRAIHGAEIDLTAPAGDGRLATSRCSCATSAAGATSAGSSRSPMRTPATGPAGASSASRRWSLQAVLDHAEGLVCLTGCAGRSVIGSGVGDEPAARRLLDAFGPEDLRVELQRPYARHDRARNRALAALARRLGVACVATGDVHAHARCRAELQDAFVALRNHTTLDASEPLRRGNASHVMTHAAGDGQPLLPTIPRPSPRRCCWPSG